MASSFRVPIVVLIAVFCITSPTLAGMPALLPSDLPTRLRLNDSGVDRLTAISFFLGGLFVCTLAVRVLWNYLQRDFAWLPRLTMLKSLAIVLLWGLLFVIVLTMISGARELMTPGAWRKQGFTYKLTNSRTAMSAAQATPFPNIAEHRGRLAEVRTALWLWAGAHGGELPESLDECLVPKRDLIYVPGRLLGNPVLVLVYEPKGLEQRRLALRTDGEIVELADEEAAQLENERSP